MTNSAQPLGVRRRNLGRVLGHLATAGPSSRAQIASAVGLTKAGVTSLAADLIARGLVAEPGRRTTGEPGRPGSVLVVDGSGCAGLGLEVNVDYLSGCVVDLARQTRFHRVDATVDRRSPKRTLDRLADIAGQAWDAATAQGLAVGGIGVALPGLVDPDAGALLHAPNLRWHGVDVAGSLADALGVDSGQITLDNEANLAASAELWFGDGAAWGDYLHVSGEIGVGAGIVRDGALIRGAHGFAGEVGHLSIDPRGPACGCGGRGCLERYCGQEAILRAAGVDGRPTTSTGRPDGPLTRLLAALDAGRVRPARAVARASAALGRGVAGAVNVLDVDTVVLGGIYSRLAPWLVEPFTESLRHNTMAARWARTRVEVSRLGPDAAVRGAAGLTVHRVLTDPASLSALVHGASSRYRPGA